MEDTVWLQRPNEQIPWGFRLQGGRDFQQPLSVQRVTAGSVAANYLKSSDVITGIGDADTETLSHAQAMSKIKSCGNSLELRISRGGSSSGLTSPKVGSYNAHTESDALHDFPKSMTDADDSARYAPPRAIRLESTESESGWQKKPQMERQYSGLNEEPVHDPITNAPPPPPPLLPPSSPSFVPQAWKNSPNHSKKKSFPDSTNEYSSTYPFGTPSSYSSDSSFGQGSPLINGGQQATSLAGYAGELDSGSSFLDTAAAAAGQTQQKTNAGPQRIPDAVLNMAAKGGNDKKPFSYIADVNDIKEHRDRVRKKTPVSSMPKYQHVLNLPQFDDPPRVRGALKTPSTPPVHNPDSGADSGEAVVANLQFNSPLQLYSSDNVVEALRGQTGGMVTDVVGLSKKDDKPDITKSAVYKMIHDIDQPKPRPVVKFAEAQPTATEHVGGSEIDTTSIRCNVVGDDSDPGSYDEKSIRYIGKNIPSRSFRLLQSMTGGADGDSTPPTVRRKIREPSSDEEMKFSRNNRSADVPSKSLQRLQVRAGSVGASPAPGATQGGSEIDRTSIRQNLNLGDDLQDSGEYEQTSIRYMGRSIPSKSFRMLQSLTGDTGSASPPPVSSVRRQQKRETRQQENELRQNPDEPVDIRYVGGHIPSQSFKMLQHSIGANDSRAPGDDHSVKGETLTSSQGRNVKVIRLRQQPSHEDPESTDF